MLDKKKYTSFYYELTENLPTVVPEPTSTALLIVDLQNEFVARDYGEGKLFKDLGQWERWKPYFDRLNDFVVPNTKKILDYFRQHNMEVTYGRIASLKHNGEDRCAVQKTPGWNGMLIPIDSYGAKIVDLIAPIEDEIVVNKTTDSVLAGTNYARLIKNMGIKTVVVCGIVTDQCVASTVRDLADEDFKVIVLEDCCASADSALHDAELKIMNNIYCQVMDSEEFLLLMDTIIKG